MEKEERKRKRRRFSQEYKAETVGLIQRSGKSIHQMALELGIGETALRRWVEQAEIEAGARAGGSVDAARARGAGGIAAGELAAADGARNPKKSDGLLRQAEPVRFAFIATEKACYPVALLCRVLQVSRAGYYAWCRRPPAPCTLYDQSLSLEVAEIYGNTAAATAARGCMRNCVSVGTGPDASGWRG